MTKLGAEVAMGIDIGGTHLRAALVDRHGKIKEPLVRHRLHGCRPQDVLEAIAAAASRLGPQAQNAPIGVGLAGQVHTRTGAVVLAPNLGWRDIYFGHMLAQHFGRSVRLVNDLNAITVGEGQHGAGGGAKHVACVFVGTGVGMGAVTHGQLVEGYDGFATELGHIKVATGPSARACGCGERGCLEAYVSGRHLPELLQEQVRLGRASRLGLPALAATSAVAADTIDAAAHQGDAASCALWDGVAAILGQALANVVTLFNSEVLILGGGVLTSAPGLKRRTVEVLRTLVARPALSCLRIVDTRLGEAAGVVGAAMLAREQSPAAPAQASTPA